MVSYHGDKWSDHVGTNDFAHAVLASNTTKMSLFEIDIGWKVSNAIVSDSRGAVKQLCLAEYARNFANKR